MKSEMRGQMRALRAGIGPERRERAAREVVERLLPLLAPYRVVLSFSPMHGEIDMGMLNEALGGRLLLPGPKPEFGVVPDLILVPGLAFSENGHRLGYGSGYYDRLLVGRSIETWGIGFVEQLVPSLPLDPWDQGLTRLYLF